MAKNVFITGGSSGIGLSLVSLYLEQGHRVGVLGRDLKKWEDGPYAKDLKASFHAAAIENRSEVKSALADFVKRFGPIDILIVNAGIGNAHKSPIPNFDTSEKILKVNVLGSLYTIEAGFELMFPHKKGQIALISSVAGYVGLAGNAAYCASKSALQRMAESYAIDFANFGIHVMCVSPGFVKTPLTQKNSHKMPFIITSETAAKLIAKGLDQKKSWIGFPWQLYGLMSFLSLVPSALYIWLSQKLKINLYKKM
jgi:NAD(P)-dependent dehydrogenase (short-subunit alcohol dehydrogenase family)